MNRGATIGESLLYETSTNMWSRLYNTWRSPFMILCKLHLIMDQNELKLDLTDNSGETLQYCQNLLCFHPQCSSLALGLSEHIITNQTITVHNYTLIYLEGIVIKWSSNGNHNALPRREPKWPFSSIRFCQNSNHSLNWTQNCSMNYDWSFLFSSFTEINMVQMFKSQTNITPLPFNTQWTCRSHISTSHTAKFEMHTYRKWAQYFLPLCFYSSLLLSISDDHPVHNG